MSDTLQLAFLGGGNMARALIQGLLGSGHAATQVRVGEPLAAQRSALQRDFGVVALADNHAAVAGARVVILAVKPQELPPLLADLRPTLQQGRPLLLSIAAGLRTADLSRACPGLAMVRAMPNRPALVGAGATGLYAGPEVGADERALAERIMGTAGITVWVPRESDLDIVTALSGSGPAYFFLLAEQLAAAASALGLEPATAELLARQTLRGAGALAATPESLAQQRAAVTSKGGTTAAALQALEQGGFGALIAAAIVAASRRGSELSEQFGRS